MTEISVTNRLRPTRIGFLVRPSDLSSIRKIMSACTCLWGGPYNPIIPVFRSAPRAWREKPPHRRLSGIEVAKGYVRFFEPDVFVEAEQGLLEKAGLGSVRGKDRFDSLVTTLDAFLISGDSRNSEQPKFGLSIVDVLRDLYKSEQRFLLRDKSAAILVKAQKGSGLAESVFGVFPGVKEAPHWYKSVFQPTEITASPDAWIEVFIKNAMTPLRVTRHGLEFRRYWHHDIVVFVFNPTNSLDLIDLWNLRLEARPVLPLPVDWVKALATKIRKVILDEHRPVKGNDRGIMHRTTLEFGRSIPRKEAEALALFLSEGTPNGSCATKYWRNPIWATPIEHVRQDGRLQITADERESTISIKEGRDLTASIEPLSPNFASRFGSDNARWINALKVRSFDSVKIATVIPFNTWNRSWPRLSLRGEKLSVGSEGWIFPQRYKNFSITIRLLTKEEAIIGSLKQLDIEATLSEPGHIAKQMLDHLGGLWDTHLLADKETLVTLNKMAGGLRRTSNAAETIEEHFDQRSVPAKNWVDLVARRNERQGISTLKLSEFTKRNIVRLGVETSCPSCQGKNWHSLTAVDYELKCERCLNSYGFPEANLRKANQNWHYRVVGPFSAPDYARGAYSALLALRVLEGGVGMSNQMTFATAMRLNFGGIEAEADFIVWRRTESFRDHSQPDLVIGEAKSTGQGQLIKRKDIEKLRAIATRLPGAILVFSVLRDSYTRQEQQMLRSLAKWGRRPNEQGRPTNPVVLLTANELFFDHLLTATWEDLGGRYLAFAKHENANDLVAIADATQQLYLGLTSFDADQEEEWKKRAAKRKARVATDA